ncbi:transposase domain-containing protein [Streptomyces sp. H51]|uniref:transposase domain-containing protein n=1 Tax=Streptomyces sp. H51 TaxID=3111770 RepID=UPI003B637B1E
MTGWGADQRVRIGILSKVFTAELVDAAAAKHDRTERRRCLLPARLVVYVVMNARSPRYPPRRLPRRRMQPLLPALAQLQRFRRPGHR